MEELGIFGVMDCLDAVLRIPALLSRAISQCYYSHMEIWAVVGVGYIMWKTFHLLCFLYTLIQLHVTPWLVNRTKHIRQYGEWAVVTGATSGIGKAYAEELARHGVNVILVSRSIEKLQEASNAITKTYGVKTRLVVADFSRGHEMYPSIKEALKDLDVGILVNNVGLFYEFPDLFADVPEDKLWEIVNVNIAAAVMMAHIVLPGMVQKKRGAIVNVTSGTSCQPCPLMTLYSASKSFLHHFSRSLHYEYSPKGIFIQTLVPFFVMTNMTGFSTFLKEKPLFSPQAKDYARQAVRTIGISKRTAGHWNHSIQLSLSARMPERLWITLCIFLCNTFRKEHRLKPLAF
ncbi:hydroxysteroid dehydrogenase-like protein 1 [Anomaloglossus baeobatrachus]|uniref:inactive hydroxysteroid dehydrogenase-like protein 1 n=1 Tax=Anomaloglossus baeobatrachus TaxID=238106 RepID=UPI003F500420